MKKLFGLIKVASNYAPTFMIAFIATLYIRMGQALVTNEFCSFPAFLKTFFVVGIVTAIIRYCIYLVLKNSMVMSVKFWQDVKQNYITSNCMFFCDCSASFTTIWGETSLINFQKFLIRRLARKFLYQNNLQHSWEVVKGARALFNHKDTCKLNDEERINDIIEIRRRFLTWLDIHLTSKQYCNG